MKKYKTLREAKKDFKKRFPIYDNGNNIYRLKRAKIWKYTICTYLDWLNGFYK